ncbi:hypothetical protein Q3G72_017959 [Acer saccharum]|nr:hypothetical protein Q3G72_017959 [Acer saccharum]
MARISETVHESSLTLANNDETVYVAVEKDIDKSKMTLTWALNNFHGKKFCILHVQQLAKVIALIGGNSPESRLEEHEDRTIRELYTKIMEKILDEYILMCEQAGVYAEKLHIEMDDIGEGIVELVYQHSIKKLVIGAAADEHYSGGMKNIKSKKAMYVLDHVPLSCQIWFICRGHLICSGKGALDGADDEDRYGSLQSISFSEMGSSHPSTSASGSSNLRFCDESESELEVLELPRFLELEQLSSSHELEGSSDNQLLDQLEQVMDEAEKLKREAFEESIRRGKAEKAVIEATRKVRALEGSYIEELRRRKEIEETAVDLSQAYEKERDKFREELDNAIDENIKPYFYLINESRKQILKHALVFLMWWKVTSISDQFLTRHDGHKMGVDSRRIFISMLAIVCDITVFYLCYILSSYNIPTEFVLGFQAIGHGISSEFLDKICQVTREYFEQPMEEKKKQAKGVEEFEGYGADPVPAAGQFLDWSDRLYLQVYPEDQRKLVFWPERPESFRGILEEYSLKTKIVTEIVSKAMAKSLNLEENCFLNQFGERSQYQARFNYYSRCQRPDLVLGLKPHADGTGYTTILQDEEGLQVLKDEQWFTVPKLSEAFLVLLGDQMEIMTNGIFKSPVHRVVTSSERERISVVVFYTPEVNKEFGPEDDLINEERPRLFKKVKDYADTHWVYYQQGQRALHTAKV